MACRSVYTAEAFMADSAEQGVTFDPYFKSNAADVARAPVYALSQAADFPPLRPIADQELDIEAFPTNGSRIMARMINATISPVIPAETDLSLDYKLPPENDMCLLAEPRFAYTFGELAKIDQIEEPRFGAEIYLDAHGDNFAVRKKVKTDTALLTRDAIIRGIPCPAGSIVVLNNPRTKKGFYENLDISLHQASDISHLGFGRLAAYSVPPDERRLPRGYKSEYQYNSYAFFRKIRPKDLFEIAQGAVEYLQKG